MYKLIKNKKQNGFFLYSSNHDKIVTDVFMLADFIGRPPNYFYCDH